MKELNSKPNGYIYSVEKIEDHDFRDDADQEKMEVIKVYCQVFGCGRQLTLPETLIGNKCFECSGIKRIDIMRVVKL